MAPRRALVLMLLSVALALLAVACRQNGATADRAPTLPVVTEARGDLLLTWIDDKGEFHVEQRVSDVPATSRESVRVVDPSRDPPSVDEVFVADLRNARADGSYPVSIMTRANWEKVAVARRAKNGAVLAAAPPSSASSGDAPGTGPAGPNARGDVIIYGASWCGPCHQAAAFFKRRGVAFVEKDIERDAGAAREMQAKLARAGRPGGSIPVIDVRGRILVGFDERSVDQALGRL